MKHVFSTLTADQCYVEWIQGGADLHIEGRSVLIKGGSNCADNRLITPIGVMTEISNEDYALLAEDQTFKLHCANGFITVRDKPANAEAVAADMATRDGSAPLVDADFEDQGKPAPVVNAKKR